MKKYRPETKGRRSLDAALEYDSVNAIAIKSRGRQQRRSALAIYLLMTFLVAGVPARARTPSIQIAVRFLDARSGKPIRKYPVVVTQWNEGAKNWPPIAKDVASSLSGRTDGNGVVVANLDPAARFITVDFFDLVGGATERIDLREVVNAGVALRFDEKARVWRPEHAGRPDEILILTRRLTLSERMRREVP